jgi:ribonuclease Z
MIDIAFLGTGAMMPTVDRWLSSALVRIDGRLILLDCGEGVQIPWRASGWGFKRLDLICISHWHADHIAGLPGVLHALALAGRDEPVTIIGPMGTRDMVTQLRQLAPVLPYDLVTADLADGQYWQFGNVTIDVRRGDHRVPVLVYRFSVPRRPAFLATIAESHGVPRANWSTLADGTDVGRWQSSDFLGPPRRGLALGFITDTRPTETARTLLDGVDLLIAEGTYGADDDLPNAIQNKHMTYREAATFARDAGAARLLLTHFSPKIEDPALWLDNARAVFPETEIADTRSVVTLNYSDSPA